MSPGVRRSAVARSGWTLRSRWIVGVVFVSLALLNFTTTLNSVGTALAITAAFVAVLNPFAAFLFVAGSQISPDPPDFPLTLAQLFVVCWVATLPFNGCIKHFGSMWIGLRYSVLFFILWISIGAINDTIDESLPYALVTAAILCTYLPRTNGHYHRVLLMLGLGSILGVLGHWGNALGFPMEGKIYDQYNRGGERAGSGRGDVNFTSVVVGFSLWTIIALFLPHLLGQQRGRKAIKIFTISMVLIVCAIPLIAMGSRGGLAYLFLGGLAILVYSFNVRTLAGKALTYAMGGSLAIILALPFLWSHFVASDLGQMLTATLEYNIEQSEKFGSSSALAGRSDIWGRFIKIVLDYPITGAPRGAVVDFGEYGIAVVGEEAAEGSGKGAAAHNFFLDLAASRGIPTALVFIVTFFLPIIRMIQVRGLLYSFPFVIAHVMVLLPLMNLSILNWKTFWALHVLTVFASVGSLNNQTNNKSWAQ